MSEQAHWINSDVSVSEEAFFAPQGHQKKKELQKFFVNVRHWTVFLFVSFVLK